MRIGILGAGNMGIGLGKYYVGNGHQLMLVFSKDKLRQAASALGKRTRTGYNMSGYGREQGAEALENYAQYRTIWTNLGQG